MLNHDFITAKARESLIDDVTITREYWQLLFLQRLYSQRGSEQMFFKGGTAIRFLLGSFRFSEDLDFTSTLEAERCNALLTATFDFLKTKSGSELEWRKEDVGAKLVNVSVSYRFLFPTARIKQKTSIRLDISGREEPLTRKGSILIPFDYPISPYPLVLHLSAAEIMAEKVRALFIRGKARDLFDLWFLLTKKIPLDATLVKQKFALYPELEYRLDRLKDKVKAFSHQPQVLKQHLNQFLPHNYREFYRKLPEETLKLLKPRPQDQKI